MATMISEEEFLTWEKSVQNDYPERAIYYDPRLERAYLLYYEVNNNNIASTYIMSEGIGADSKEILFKFSVMESGEFQSVTNLAEFHERADELANQSEPRMN